MKVAGHLQRLRGGQRAGEQLEVVNSRVSENHQAAGANLELAVAVEAVDLRGPVGREADDDIGEVDVDIVALTWNPACVPVARREPVAAVGIDPVQRA